MVPMTNNINRALLHILETHSRFVIASEHDAPQEVMLAKEALRALLFYSGKHFFSYPGALTALAKEYQNMVSVIPQNTLPSDVIISFPADSNIGEVRYENEARPSFIITPKEKFDISGILTREMLPVAEAGFFFFPYDHALTEDIARYVALPSREKIIFLAKNTRTFAEKIFDISRAAPDFKPNEIFATLLYASLAEETDNFRENVSVRTFEIAKELIEIGANKDLIRSVSDTQKNINQAHIMGRALARTQVDSKTSSSWTFLAESDFQKAHYNFFDEYTLPYFIKTVRRALPPARASFLLWENGGNVHACVYSEDENMLSFFAGSLGKAQKNRYLVVDGFKNFSEAEIKLKEVLKDMLVNTPR